MKRKLAPVLALALPMGIAVLSQAPSAHAEAACSDATLHDSYAYSADGYAPPPFTPIAEAGIYVFDGSGGFSTANTISVGGKIIPRTATGTYAVDVDCTGTGTVSGGVSFNFAITRAAQSLRFVVSTPGVVVAGTMEKQ